MGTILLEQLYSQKNLYKKTRLAQEREAFSYFLLVEEGMNFTSEDKEVALSKRTVNPFTP